MEEIADKKEFFMQTLTATNRTGMGKLLAMLEKTDFYTAPASTQYHSCHEGGLLHHSVRVYLGFREKNVVFNLRLKDDTVAISGLLHDVCKTQTYRKGVRNIKQGKRADGRDNWVEKEVWETNDMFPVGHGEKSVIVLQHYLRLTKPEIFLIRWHMGSYSEELWKWNRAVAVFPPIVALHTADMESSFLIEERPAVAP